MPRTTIYSALELLLLSLLAMQSARLVWTIVTPVGPVGEWKASAALRPTAVPSPDLLGSFDPFFRLSSTSNAPVVVTSLNLKLYGVRENRASGLGSAIISTPDGQQRSFAVGDEIVPGVVLTAVGFDNVTITRAGLPEQLFLDQSPPANGAAGTTVTPPATLVAPPPPTPMPVIEVPPQPPMVGQTNSTGPAQ